MLLGFGDEQVTYTGHSLSGLFAGSKKYEGENRCLILAYLWDIIKDLICPKYGHT